jgi:membrane peptidoglycan carboxypeptidase
VTKAPTADPTAPPLFDRAAARRRRIGEVLVTSGVIDEEQLHQALAAQAAQPSHLPRRKLGAMIVELGLATERRSPSLSARR